MKRVATVIAALGGAAVMAMAKAAAERWRPLPTSFTYTVDECWATAASRQDQLTGLGKRARFEGGEHSHETNAP
jgi:hypothetical protein